jgi:hypothetical protein
MQTSRRELAESFITWFSFTEAAAAAGEHSLLVHILGPPLPQPWEFCTAEVYNEEGISLT